MAKPALFYDPRPQFHVNGTTIAAGYLLFFHETGTSTKKNTYNDNTFSTINPNPIILDTLGRPDNSGTPIDIWLDGEYTVTLAPPTDTDPPTSAVWSVDNVKSIWSDVAYTAKTGNYTLTASDNGSIITVDASGAARTITLLAAATAGAGYTITIKKIDNTTNAVTLDGNASETIDGAVTNVLRSQYESVQIICDGSNWHIMHNTLMEAIPAAVTTTYTTTVNDDKAVILADASGGAFTITLLAATTAGNGHVVTIKKSDSSANLVTIDGDGTETIDGNLTKTLNTQYESVKLVCDGSNWHVAANVLREPVATAITTTYTTTVNDDKAVILADASGGAFTITLLAAATAGNGHFITIKKSDSSVNAVTIDGNGTETIDGSTTYALNTQYDSIKLVCDGSNWHIAAKGLLSPVWEQISTATASASASIEFTGLTDAYSEYKCVMYSVVPATDLTSLYLTIKDTVYLTTAYFSHRQYSRASSTNQVAGDTNAAQWTIIDDLSTAAGEALNGQISLYNVGDAVRTYGITQFADVSGTGAETRTTQGALLQTGATAITAIKFAMASGNVASGTFELYGLRN